METAIVPLAETMALGDVLAKSGFFDDSRQAAQAVVKVLAGRELGIGPIASMVGIHIIKGKPAIGANVIASAIKRSGRYNYRIRKHDNSVCEIEFFERSGDKWESVGSSTFTVEDARKAGTQNLERFARNMLFARCISNGARWYTPDIFGGAPVYTPEEMGAQVDGDGDVIDVTPRIVEPQAKANGHDAELDAIPGAADTTRCTDAQRKAMFAIWKHLYGADSVGQFRDWLKQHYGTEHTSELTVAQASAVIDALKAEKQMAGVA
jgi:hypothetical protein